MNERVGSHSFFGSVSRVSRFLHARRHRNTCTSFYIPATPCLLHNSARREPMFNLKNCHVHEAERCNPSVACIRRLRSNLFFVCLIVIGLSPTRWDQNRLTGISSEDLQLVNRTSL